MKMNSFFGLVRQASSLQQRANGSSDTDEISKRIRRVLEEYDSSPHIDFSCDEVTPELFEEDSNITCQCSMTLDVDEEVDYFTNASGIDAVNMATSHSKSSHTHRGTDTRQDIPLPRHLPPMMEPKTL